MPKRPATARAAGPRRHKPTGRQIPRARAPLPSQIFCRRPLLEEIVGRRRRLLARPQSRRCLLDPAIGFAEEETDMTLPRTRVFVHPPPRPPPSTCGEEEGEMQAEEGEMREGVILAAPDAGRCSCRTPGRQPSCCAGLSSQNLQGRIEGEMFAW